MEISPSRHGRVQNVLVAVVMVVYLALAWQAREDTDLDGSDELEYRALSQSLAQGSYREIFQVTAPWSVKYPPAYPAFLLALRTVVGDNLEAVRLANIAFIGIGLVLLFLVARQFAGGWLALGVLLVSAVNPYTLANAGSMMSEAMYFCLVTLVLYAAYVAEHRKAWWAIPIILVVPFIAFLTRTAGITIVTAGVWIKMRRPRRELYAYTVAAIVVVGGWFYYAKNAPHEMAASDDRDFSDARAGESSNFAVRTVSRMATTSVWMLTRTAVQTFAFPTVEGTIVDNVAWVAVMVVLIPLGLFVLWQSWRAMLVYLVVYSGLLVAWPYTGFRILSVIVPFVFLTMFLGARHLFSRFQPRVGRIGFGVLIPLMLFGAMKQNAERFEDGVACNREEPLALYGCHDINENAMLKSREFLATHAKPTDIIATSKGASMYFLTHLKTTPSRYLRDFTSGAVVDTLRVRGVRYLLVGVFVPHEDGPFADALLPRCNELRLEVNDLPHGILLSVLPPGETSEDACKALPLIRRAISASPS